MCSIIGKCGHNKCFLWTVFTISGPHATCSLETFAIFLYLHLRINTYLTLHSNQAAGGLFPQIEVPQVTPQVTMVVSITKIGSILDDLGLGEASTKSGANFGSGSGRRSTRSSSGHTRPVQEPCFFPANISM